MRTISLSVRLDKGGVAEIGCPKCQGQARTKWLTDRWAKLLPVPYFHLVFTLPAPIAEIAFQNKTTVSTIQFSAAADAMTALAANPRRLVPRSAASRFYILGVRP